MGDKKLKKIVSILVFLFLFVGVCFTGYLAFTADSDTKTQKHEPEKKNSKKELKKDKGNNDSPENNQTAETDTSVPIEQNYGTDSNNQTTAPIESSYDAQNKQSAESPASTIDSSVTGNAVEDNTTDDSDYTAQQQMAAPEDETNTNSSVQQ